MKLLPRILALTAQWANTTHASDAAFLRGLVDISCEETTPEVVRRWAEENAAKRKVKP